MDASVEPTMRTVPEDLANLRTAPEHHKTELRRLSDVTGALIPAIGTAAFPNALREFFVHFTTFDMFVAIYYCDRNQPVELIFVNQPQHPPETLDIYRAGAYRLDPIFSCCAEGIDPGVYTLRSLTPVTFNESPYYQTFYGNLGLGDEADFFIKVPAGGYVVLTLARNANRPDFTQEQLLRLSDIAPLVEAIVRGHILRSNWQDLVYHPSRLSDQNAGDVFTSLSEREREVAIHILRGFNSEAIGLQLNISENTVKVHRRKVYEKLGVTSITELFLVFLRDCGVDVDAVWEHLMPHDSGTGTALA